MVEKTAEPTPSRLPEFQVNITRARKLWGAGTHCIIMVGSKVDPSHVFKGWGLGAVFGYNRQDEETFDTCHNSFLFYLDPALGRYARFYAIPTRKRD